jgi:hypothetical protein
MEMMMIRASHLGRFGILCLLCGWPAQQAGAIQIHVATAGNISGNSTYLDLAYSNGNPWRVVQVTPVWNPGGSGGVYNNHPIGVWYDTGRGRWAVFNQDLARMPTGAAFFVADSPATSNVYVHRATAGNIVSNWTYLDNALLNGVPGAQLYVTPVWNPGGSGGVYNNHPIGVWYDTGRGRWAVFNQDLAHMPTGAAFNIVALPPNYGYVARATAANVIDNSTYLDLPIYPSVNDMYLWVTPVWNPGGSGGVYNNHPIGVWYDTWRGKWAIFNQDLARMPTGAAFNVRVFLTPG